MSYIFSKKTPNFQETETRKKKLLILHETETLKKLLIFQEMELLVVKFLTVFITM